jgi:hypothetical protein
MGGGQEGYGPQQYNQLPPINQIPIHQVPIQTAPQAPSGMPGGSWNSINYAPTPALSIQDYLNHPTIPENQVPITATSIPRVDICIWICDAWRRDGWGSWKIGWGVDGFDLARLAS